MQNREPEQPQSRLTERGRRRLNTVIVLAIITLLLMLSLIAQSGFNLSSLVSPDNPGETLLLYSLSTLNFLAFVLTLFVLLRNVLKLLRERRAGQAGSKFKARLVGYAIALSLLPVLLLFFFAFGLINRSIDRWFSGPASQIVSDAKAVKESYFQKEEDDLTTIALAIAQSLPPAQSRNISDDFEPALRQAMSTYHLRLARLIQGERRLTLEASDKAVEPDIKETLNIVEGKLAGGDESASGEDDGESPINIFVISGIKLNAAPGERRALVLAREFPPGLTRRAANIDDQFANFHNLQRKMKRIKTIYVLLLAAVALLLIFSASWIALHVARGITVPIQALAEATERVAKNDFSRPVEVEAEDELASLITSFNQMAGQLDENRHRLERAADDLQERRRYIETVLESLSTGVISTDVEMRITTINRAALYMLGIRDRPSVGTQVSEIAGPDRAGELAVICRRAQRTGLAQADIRYQHPSGGSLQTATTAVPLRSSGGALQGWVIVIEDLTDLIQAERVAAWSEVARRMAHEIKNPLTPIQLSAERIIRNYERTGESRNSRFEEVVREGTATISREVATLQRMVEEFSRFARLPEARPVDASLNEVIRAAVGLYADRLDGFIIECDLADDIPSLKLDPDQIKRVLVNLIDNALEAMSSDTDNGANGVNGAHENTASRVGIESRFIETSEIARITVSDVGHGIRATDRDKLFLPKFSTRDRATGLGLAIVSHIVADHNGRIWVEDNEPRGATFIIELPVVR
ncbi:MAG: hypothetical protein DMF61_01915 [Blastocatellia bacterium AA13]|nr:MAG: hypothetical protein DMF61_01915 [Blastocatellia bacterium AA13]